MGVVVHIDVDSELEVLGNQRNGGNEAEGAAGGFD